MGKNAALEAMLAQRAGKPKPDALNAMLAKRAGAAQPAAVTTPTNATAPCYLTPLDRPSRRMRSPTAPGGTRMRSILR